MHELQVVAMICTAGAKAPFELAHGSPVQAAEALLARDAVQCVEGAAVRGTVRLPPKQIHVLCTNHSLTVICQNLAVAESHATLQPQTQRTS
jgi:hypothetical protein